MKSRSTQFRSLLTSEKYLFTSGVYSALDARIAEQVGLKSIYMSGYSVALMHGFPDLGLLDRSEVTRTATYIARAVNVPVIADADEGYGNALGTIRTVEEYIRTGVAGIHLEDQQPPKRCGHIAGKTILPREEAVGKFRAAVDTRNRLAPDFVLIARTDAYGAVGGSMEEALWRGRAYADAGVDLVWSEFSTSDPGTAITFAEGMRKTHPQLPLAFNYSSSFKWSAKPDALRFSELGELGYKFIFITIFAPHAAMFSVWNALKDLAENEEEAQWRLEKIKTGHPTESHHKMARVPFFQELEERYIPDARARHAASEGFRKD